MQKNIIVFLDFITKNIIVFLDFITKNKTTEFFNQWFLDIISFLGYNLPLLLS